MQAALQAWHVAGLQGWAALQARLAGAVGALLPGLPGGEAEQVAPVLGAMPHSCWLAYLLAPGALQGTVAGELGLEEGASASGGGGGGGGAGHIALQAAAEVAEAAAEGAAPRLAAARAHLAAAHAALRAGELPVAACCGERAAALSSSVFFACFGREDDAAAGAPDGSGAAGSSSGSGGSGSGGAQERQPPAPQPAAPPPAPPTARGDADGLLHWQALGLYVSSLLLAGTTCEVAGSPDESLRLLREAAALSSAARAAGPAAAAHASMARVWCRRGDAARAGAQLRLAEAAARALACDSAADGGVAAVMTALAACAAGDIAAAAGESTAAAVAYAAAAEQAQPAVGGGGGCGALAWSLGGLWADAQAGLAACDAAAGDTRAAVARLDAALAALCEDRWPAAAAALALEAWALKGAAALDTPPPPAGEGGRALRLVGFGGASAHSNLLEEFAGAVGSGGGGGGDGGGAAKKGRGGSAKARKPAAPAKKAAAAGGGGEGAEQLLRPLLRLLAPCRHAPLLLRRLCGLLASVCERQGAPHACAAFLQLGIGPSITQQQLIAVSGKLQQARRRIARGSSGGDDGDDGAGAPDWAALQQALCCSSLCCELAAAAGDVADGAALLAAAEAAGRRWLRSQMARLPRGTAAVSISAAPGGGGGLVLCRLEAPDAAPLLAVLPPPERGPASSPQELAGLLAAILDDSAASMAGSGALTADADKTAWWRARIALDERLAALLAHAGGDWLGPWRCLLAAPAAGGARRRALRGAAVGFVAEHFEFVFGAARGGEDGVAPGSMLPFETAGTVEGG